MLLKWARQANLADKPEEAARLAEQALNPLIGKSFVAYATKPHLPGDPLDGRTADAAA